MFKVCPFCLIFVQFDTSLKGEKYGLINFTGNELLACEYDDITPLKGVKNSLVTLKNGKLEQAILDAKKMLAENLDVNLIMKITGLKKEQFMK